MCSFTLCEDGSKFMESNEGYVALYKGEKITQEEYDKLCLKLKVDEIREVK